MDAPDIERLTRELVLRKRLQESFLVFSRGIAAKLTLSTALESFTREVNELLGTARTAVWLYDREARVLNLAASSDPREVTPSALRADEDSPVVHALGGDAPEKTGSGAGSCLAAPMRGWRRALGVLVIEGEPSWLSGEQFVELSGDLARQLSVSVENLIVLDQAIRGHGDHQEVRSQLARTEKLASLGRLVAVIAHEMRNPLQGVLGHLELLLQTLPDDATDRPALERIHNDADRAARIVDNLLLYAGAQRPARRPIDVPRLIADTVALRQESPHRPHVGIVSQVPADLPPVVGDATLLQQALLNLVINAEQAIAGATGSGQVFLTSRWHNGFVSIDIEDTGPGIGSDVAPRIFDPFFTTKDIGKGTGLGLAITFRIVQEHGGTIQAGASPHGGARFTIQLPAAQ